MSATVKAEVWRVIVRFVFALGAIVCLAGFGAPLVFGSEAVEGKLCCDETCSRKLWQCSRRTDSTGRILIHAHHLC